MLNFAPDGMAGGGSGFIQGERSSVPQPSESRGLLALIAAMNGTGISATFHPAPVEPPRSGFRPERMSGYCASA